MADGDEQASDCGDCIIEIVAHVLLMGRGAYPSPEAWANALLMRLNREGYQIVPKQEAGNG